VLAKHRHDAVRFNPVASRRPGQRPSIQLLPLGVEAHLGDEVDTP
jgi:hypothetical protein